MNKVDFKKIDIGFGRMAEIYDANETDNNVIKIMRTKFRSLVIDTFPPPAQMLEINCGSGLDAHYFAGKGYNVLATDISEEMINSAVRKSHLSNLQFAQLNYNELEKLNGAKFHCIISNYGGLNCTDNIFPMSKKISDLLYPGGCFIAAIMPRFFLWEFLLLFKGEFKRALRRIKPGGTYANIGSEKIFVRYYSPRFIIKAFKKEFYPVKTNALRILAPPSIADYWYSKFYKLSKLLERIDNLLEDFYPAAFMCDYYILVLKKKSTSSAVD